MSRFIKIVCALLVASALSACVATAPVKVATKSAKIATKTSKTGVKAAAKVGSVVTP